VDFASIYNERFSFEVGNLVTARNRGEFELVKASYERQIQLTEDPREKAQYGRLLTKAGLGIDNNSIVITNADRWRKVSIWDRIEMWNIPATTNSEKSMNGHMNDNTPRKNSFWLSMYSISA
jgi:hypothetical protein